MGIQPSFLEKNCCIVSFLWDGVSRTTASTLSGQNYVILCITFPLFPWRPAGLELTTNALSSWRHWLLLSMSPSVVNLHSLTFYFVLSNTYSLHHWIGVDQGHIRSSVHPTYKLYWKRDILNFRWNWTFKNVQRKKFIFMVYINFESRN